MTIRYLGTGAAEGIPALFCRCPVCRKAAERGGKEKRTRSQALVDGKILLDFPPDTYAHYLSGGFDLPGIERLLVTHAHSDHFYAEDLIMRQAAYAAQEFKTLHIWGDTKVEERYYAVQLEQREGVENCRFHLLRPFDTVAFDDYRITAFPALHNRREDCLFYAIERGGKALLYVHDSGLPPASFWDYLAERKPRFDLVSLDCTCVTHKDGSNHMGLADNEEMRRRLLESGAASSATVFVLNHFSHNGGLNHEELSHAAQSLGFLAACDGLAITF